MDRFVANLNFREPCKFLVDIIDGPVNEGEANYNNISVSSRWKPLSLQLYASAPGEDLTNGKLLLFQFADERFIYVKLVRMHFTHQS